MTGHSNWSSEIPMRAGPRPERRSIAELKLESERGGIFKPPGLRLDLGGIGKGYAVDKAAGILATARDFLIDAGGDVYAAGMAPGNEVWRIGIASPNQADVDLEAVELHEQAIATSTTATRRWRRGGQLEHHLIDPTTGRPSESNVLSVSVIAATATEADVFAKTALILGRARGPAFLEERGVAGLFVLIDGQIFRTQDWPAATA